MRLPGFVGPAYTSQSKIAAADDLVNLYPEKIESGTGPDAYVLYSAPGYRQWCNLGLTNPVRGQFILNGTAYAVAKDTIFTLPITSGGSPVTLAGGLTNPDDSLVSMAGNGDGGFQLVIASAGSLFCLDLRTNILTPITNISASFVTFVDGTFYALDPSASKLYASAPEDGSTWDALDVAQRSDQADKWNTLLLSRGELWLPGSKSGSVYYDTGDTTFPFSPNPSGKLTGGILAPRSAAVVDGAPMWLQQNADGGAIVVMAQGYTLQRVSTHAVENAFAGYGTLFDADAFSYQANGHTFYVLNFPTANASWVYDRTAGLWHRRGAWTGNDYGVLPVRTHIYAFGTHLVGSRTTGIIWEMTNAVYTDTDTTGLRRMRRAPHLVDEGRRNIYDALRIHAETGLGLNSGQGSDPQGMLRWSDDGGQTWSNSYAASFGPRGSYRTRAIWRRLYGVGDDRVFEFTYSDPTPLSLIDAFVDMRGGVS